MGKVRYLVFSNFLLVLTTFLFWEEDWTLTTVEFHRVFEIFLCLTLFGNSSVNSYLSFLLVIIKSQFSLHFIVRETSGKISTSSKIL